MRISWTQSWKAGVVKEEKKVLAAVGCGSLALAFLIVAGGGMEIFMDGHSGAAMMRVSFAGLWFAPSKLCSNRIILHFDLFR